MKCSSEEGPVSQLKRKYCNLQYEFEICFRYRLPRKTITKIALEREQIRRKIDELGFDAFDLNDIPNSDYYKEIAEKLKMHRKLNC